MKYAGVSIQHLLSLGSRSPAETLSICNWVLCWINQQFIFFTKITSSPLTQIYINNLCQITCQGKTYKILSCHPVTLSPVFHFLYFSNLYIREVGKPLFKSLQATNTDDLLDLWQSLTFDVKFGELPSFPQSRCSVSGYDSKFLQNEISRMEWNQWIKELLLLLFARSYDIPNLGLAWVTEKDNLERGSVLVP